MQSHRSEEASSHRSFSLRCALVSFIRWMWPFAVSLHWRPSLCVSGEVLQRQDLRIISSSLAASITLPLFKTESAIERSPTEERAQQTAASTAATSSCQSLPPPRSRCQEILTATDTQCPFDKVHTRASVYSVQSPIPSRSSSTQEQSARSPPWHWSPPAAPCRQHHGQPLSQVVTHPLVVSCHVVFWFGDIPIARALMSWSSSIVAVLYIDSFRLLLVPLVLSLSFSFSLSLR